MASSYVAIVTGANRGIGLECVRRLGEALDSTATVILCSRNLQNGENAKEGLGAQKCDIVVKELDIGNQESVNAFVNSIKSEYQEIDLLINNAGFAFPMSSNVPFPQQARETIDINYYGTKRMCDTFLPLLKTSGRIINVSSTSGLSAYKSCSDEVKALWKNASSVADIDSLSEKFVTLAMEENLKGWPSTAYGTSKLAVNALSKTIFTEDHPVVACCPGFCRTNMTGGRNDLSSWVMWAAGYIVGQSAYAGADTPVWLGLLPLKELQKFRGRLVRNREAK